MRTQVHQNNVTLQTENRKCVCQKVVYEGISCNLLYIDVVVIILLDVNGVCLAWELFLACTLFWWSIYFWRCSRDCPLKVYYNRRWPLLSLGRLMRRLYYLRQNGVYSYIKHMLNFFVDYDATNTTCQSKTILKYQISNGERYWKNYCEINRNSFITP